jgi:hypothetical protein
MVQFIRPRGDVGFGARAGFISDHRTASELLSQREAVRMVPNFAHPIILAKISRHSAGAWLYAHCAKINLKLELEINVDYCA